MFELTAIPIDASALSARLSRPDAGALVVFEGRVRNHHLGAPVTHLEYEAFDELAITEGAAVVDEAQRLYPGVAVLCVHRIGALRIGETALWIGVASAHRQVGFAACRHVIEEIKRRLPIWKKEHHPDGAAEWVNCTSESHAKTVTDYHERQIGLPEIGAAGQARIVAARVLVVGIGGLGCPAALYLATAGVGRLTLVDGGRVELSNLHRQILFTPDDVGAPKTLAAAVRLRRQNPSIETVGHETSLTVSNARSLVAGHQVVLDCTDNFTARFALHDACLDLDVPLVSAAVHRFEGTLDVFRRDDRGCLHCQWPDHTAEDFDLLESCDGAPVFAPTVGMLGVAQAAECLKLILGVEGETGGRTLLVNLREGSFLSISRTRNTDCPVCGPKRYSAQHKTSPRVADEELFVSAQEAESLGERVRQVYLAGPGDAVPADCRALPIGDLNTVRRLAMEGPVVISCRRGLRSATAARALRGEGIPHVYALQAATGVGVHR